MLIRARWTDGQHADQQCRRREQGAEHQCRDEPDDVHHGQRPWAYRSVQEKASIRETKHVCTINSSFICTSSKLTQKVTQLSLKLTQKVTQLTSTCKELYGSI